MTMTYPQKHYVLDHLSHREHWHMDYNCEDHYARYEARQKDKAGGTRATYRCGPDAVKAPLWDSQCAKRVEFLFNDAAGHGYPHLADAARLVIAYDLDIEPGLQLISREKIKRQFHEHLSAAQDNLYSGLGMASSSARDSHLVLNTGYDHGDIDVPRHFMLEALPADGGTGLRGFKLRVPVSLSAAILTKTNAWKHSVTDATRNDARTVESPHKTSVDFILDALRKADALVMDDTLEAVRWQSIIIRSPYIATATKAARDALVAHLGLDTDQYAIINFSPERTVVAVQTDAFETAMEARAATHDVLRVINGATLPSGMDARAFIQNALQRGADLKYTDPHAVRGKNESFATRMLQAESYELLGILKDLQGVADHSIKPPAAPRP